MKIVSLIILCFSFLANAQMRPSLGTADVDDISKNFYGWYFGGGLAYTIPSDANIENLKISQRYASALGAVLELRQFKPNSFAGSVAYQYDFPRSSDNPFTDSLKASYLSVNFIYQWEEIYFGIGANRTFVNTSSATQLNLTSGGFGAEVSLGYIFNTRYLAEINYRRANINYSASGYNYSVFVNNVALNLKYFFGEL